MNPVVLVPVLGPIDPGCDAALRHLEARGVPVRRAFGHSAIDVARNRLTADALAQAVGLPVHDLRAQITMLEVVGKVRRRGSLLERAR